MAKTIKFNLICDGEPVRTIEDLQNNFSIDDVLAYYSNKLLHRWLKVRGYDAYLKSVEAIDAVDPLSIVEALVKIFGIETDAARIRESIYMIQFRHERQEMLSTYNDLSMKADMIVQDFRSGYQQLIDNIVNNPSDIAKIRASVAEMIRNYLWLLKIDSRNLFFRLRNQAPMALFIMLTHQESRLMYKPKLTDGEKRERPDYDLSLYRYEILAQYMTDVMSTYSSAKEQYNTGRYNSYLDIDIASCSIDKNDLVNKIVSKVNDSSFVYQEITDQNWQNLRELLERLQNININNGYIASDCSKMEEMINEYTFKLTSMAKTILGHNLQRFTGVTDGYWKDLEPENKKYMIISIAKGDFVRSAGKRGEELGYDDVYGYFPILDGIDYKSNDSSHELLYLEV